MKSKEWEELIEKMGGQKIAIPPDQIETVQSFVNDWKDAQSAFQTASHLVRATRERMHEYVELILPQLEGWNYRIESDKNQVGLLFPEDKE